MYKIIQHSHSGIMWLVILLLLTSIVMSLYKFIKKEEAPLDYKIKLFRYTKWFIYLQATLGFILLYLSPNVHYVAGFMKSDKLRFFGLEHPLMMLIAVGFVAIGLYKAKKKESTIIKNKTILIYYSIAFVIMMAIIPWHSVLG